MRLDLMTFFPCQAVPMLQSLLSLDYGWNGFFLGAMLHLAPEGRCDLDIGDWRLTESHVEGDCCSFSSV